MPLASECCTFWMNLQFCHFQKVRELIAIFAVAICSANQAARSAPAAATNSSFHLLDLSKFYTYSFTNLSTNRPWTSIPRGRQTNDGVPFQLAGVIELTGMDDARRGILHATAIASIPAGFKAQRIHLL